MEKYYMISQKNKNADIYIFGDIVSFELFDSDVSSHSLSVKIRQLDGVENITVHINSFGGSVAEGLAIYNELVNHPAKITTICEGFACSAASLVFMAGDERVMRKASLLMIHNAWMYTAGNADELRKDAADLDKISDTAANVYRDAELSISDIELKQMLDAETWITPGEALDMGFATSISGKQVESVAASAQDRVYALMLAGIFKNKLATAAPVLLSDEILEALSEECADGDETPDEPDDFEEALEETHEAEPEHEPDEPETSEDAENEPLNLKSGFIMAINKFIGG